MLTGIHFDPFSDPDQQVAQGELFQEMFRKKMGIGEPLGKLDDIRFVGQRHEVVEGFADTGAQPPRGDLPGIG
jgi:hypothetical protein